MCTVRDNCTVFTMNAEDEDIDDGDDLDMAMLAFALATYSKKKRKAKRRFKTRPLNRSRKLLGFYNVYVKPMKEIASAMSLKCFASYLYY